MKMLIIAMLLGCSLGAPLNAGSLKAKEYDLASTTVSGDVVRCPRRIVAKNLNVLRYDYHFNATISFSAAVDLWSKLAAVVPGSLPAAAAPKGGNNTTDKVIQDKAEKHAAAPGCGDGIKDPLVIQHVCDAASIELAANGLSAAIAMSASNANGYNTELSVRVQEANSAIESVRAGGSALKNFLLTTNGNSAQTLAGITSQLQDTPGTPSTFIRGTKAEWPDLNKIASLITGTVVLQAQLNQQTTALTALASRVSSVQHDLQADVVRVKEPGDQTAALREIQHLQDASDVLLAATASLASSSALNGRISAILNDLQQSSTKYTDFIAARDLLITWRVRMATLKEDSKTDRFSMSIDTTSDFAFSRTKSTAVTLTRIDMMPGTTATSAETVLSVAAECTSPFTISAGAAFTTLAEREFGIQAVVKNADVSKTDTVNQFVAVTKSSFHPLPIGLVNVRLWEPSEWFSLHASFGIAGNLKSQSAGGSDADFLMGPSISFFRTMFLTGGLHLGREVALGANYKLGDQVPSSVTTPPLQKSYKAAFGFAITFTKP